jgi:hypothetical protein
MVDAPRFGEATLCELMGVRMLWELVHASLDVLVACGGLLFRPLVYVYDG